MQTTQTVEECIRFGAHGRLAGILSYPADALPRRAVLLCSPHPNFAGDMHNNVITALANRLSEDSVTLRFDYRGIGESRIELPTGTSVFDYWDAVEEAHDYGDALVDASDAIAELSRAADSLPLFAAGYSFGALIVARASVADPRFLTFAGIGPPLTRISFDFVAGFGRPCLFISGQEDFVYDPAVAASLIEIGKTKLVYDRIPGADHFFREQECLLADRVAAFFAEGVSQ